MGILSVAIIAISCKMEWKPLTYPQLEIITKHAIAFQSN